jgi:4-amino-4-deoxy-L-arabinose transferase-like glycosyltransferase
MTALPYGLSNTAGDRLSWRAYVLLLGLALIMFLPGLAKLPPIDRDEPRYAQASKQMIESGDYLDIHFMSDTRYKKPIGIYWLQSTSARIFGTPPYDVIWPYRVPSLLGAIMAVLLTVWGVTRVQNAPTGFLAGAILLSAPLLNFESRIGKTDAALLATICLTQFIMARAYIRSEPLPRCLAIIFWIGQAAGILIKGPITPFVSLCTIVALWACDRRLTWFRQLRPWRGLALCVALVVPWLIWIGIASHGAFYSESVDHDFMGKIFSGQDRGFLPPGYHLALFIPFFGAFVWIALRGLMLAWQGRTQPALRFILAWIVPVWIINELIFTKLPHYVLPCYPAIAWAAAHGVAQLVAATTPTPTRRWQLLNIACGCIMLAIIAATALFPLFVPVPFLYRSAAIGVIAAGLIVAQMRWQIHHPIHALACGVAAVVLLMKIGFGLLVPGLKPILLTPLASAAYDSIRPCPFSHLITSGYTEPSLVFMAGTPTFFANGAAYAEQLLARDVCAVVMIVAEQEEEFNVGLLIDKLAVERVGTINGFNYNGGGWKTFVFYRQLPPERFAHVE